MRAALVLLLCLVALKAQAHDARPVAVTITETLPGFFQWSLRVPPTVEANNLPVLVWPAICSAAANDGSLMRCEAPLAGAQFRLDYPLFNPSLATYYRLQLLDGATGTSLLAPNAAEWTVPLATSRARVARDYLLLGVEHIIGGLDHLLFVLGLLVIARTPKRILLAVTGFTLAHSLTLSLAALELIALPIAPVEATIALSILFLAHEISQQRNDSSACRYPLLLAFGFGLLHGLGFASALGEIGLVRNEVLISLLFFNLGVELGQVLFILAVVALGATLQAVLRRAQGVAAMGEGLAARRIDLLAAYVIGVPSAFWLIERLAQFL